MRVRMVTLLFAAALGGSSALAVAQAAQKDVKHSGADANTRTLEERSADGLPYNDIETAPGGVKYLTGGIGTEAQERLDARADYFNLKLVFTLNEGSYIADVRVTVKDAQGRTVVEDTADGPFFMARLPPGQYTVEARYNGKTLTRHVRVGERGTRTAYLRWPSDPRTDFIISARR